MIRQRRPATLPQGGRYTLGSGTAATIDNGRIFPVALKGYKQLLQFRTFGLHGNIEVGPMKA